MPHLLKATRDSISLGPIADHFYQAGTALGLG
jgi:hypothetical protein